ncbi:hypothetical protein VaNZ11_002398 [Volvox africanus]|uniref:TRP C-terminal domain-containing protein n=1 Tax=Volvox africanus TaxID=51714 RepID=A0ABQ5RT23_9CHLO|nr:hypothetical protein VaNZ11_002398 [Volvox africanus]
MMIPLFLIVTIVSTVQLVDSGSRPWCLGGVGLCRGKDIASEQFSHTMTMVYKDVSSPPKAYLLGGQRSTAASSFVSLNSITTVDMKDMTLMTTTKVNFSIGDAARPQRSGHSAVAYRGSVLVFGGLVVNRTESKDPVATNEVIWLEQGSAFSTPVWRVLFNRTRSGLNRTVPVPRQNAAAAIFNDTLWIFGGVDNDTQILDDTWSFDIQKQKWTRYLPSVRGSVPRDSNNNTGLQKSAMITTRDGLYLLLYGGRGQSPASGSSTVTSTPQNQLWAFEVASGNWELVDMGLSDEANPFSNDATMLLMDVLRLDSDGNVISTSNGSELLIASTGFWTPQQDVQAYKMWADFKYSSTGGAFQELLSALFNDTIAASLSIINSTIPFSPSAIFISNTTRTVLQVNAENTPIDLGAYGSRSAFSDRIMPVKDAALALYKDMDNQLKLLISGGHDPTGKASSKLVIVDLDFQAVVDTSTTLKPPTADGKIFRYGEYSVVPRFPNTGDYVAAINMRELLIYTGADNLDDDSEPLVTEFAVIDTAIQKVLPRCSSTNQARGTCKVLSAPRNVVDDLPGPRDGFALTSIFQVFNSNDANGQNRSLGGRLLLMYGGMRLVGDMLNDTGGASSGDVTVLSSDEQSVRNMLGECDTQGVLDSIQLNEMAQCGVPKLAESNFCPGDANYYWSSTEPESVLAQSTPPDALLAPPPDAVWPGPPLAPGTHGQLGQQPGSDPPPDAPPDAPAVRRRSVLEEAEFYTGESNEDGQEGGIYVDFAAASAWGNRAVTASGATLGTIQQRTAAASKASKSSPTSDGTQSDPGLPTVYRAAYAVLWQSTDDVATAPLVNPDAEYKGGLVLPGPAFIYDQLWNTNGSLLHAPGERAAATLANFPFSTSTNADAILFGGLTAVNKTANAVLGVPYVTNDVYYLQYIPGVPGGYGDTASSLPEARFPSCPFTSSDGKSLCKSVAVFPQGSNDIGESKPPTTTSTDTSVQVYEDCPQELASGTRGTFQLRVYRSIDKTKARQMGIAIYDDSGTAIVTLPSVNGQQDFTKGLCCAGNSSQWAWPPDVPEARVPPTQRNTSIPGTTTTTNTTDDEYWFILSTGEYTVYLTSGTGRGWTDERDLKPPFNCSTSAPDRCPRIELFHLESNRTIRGLGGLGQYTTWIAAANTSGDFIRVYRLSLCGPQPPPPQQSSPPSPTSRNPFPFVVEGQPNLLRSYELQLAPDHATDEVAMPKRRMWHASCFVETRNLPKSLGFGSLGLLAVHGGVTNHKMDEIDIETELLGDLWVFDLEYRRWIEMTGDGDHPGKRLKHNMKASGNVIFLSGGFTYDPDNQNWPYSTKVYYIDLQLGVDAVWTQVDGDDTTVGRRTSPTAITQGMGVSQRRSQLVTLNDQGVVFVPMPTSTTLNFINTDSNSSTLESGNNNSSAPVVVTALLLEAVINQMYDGDLLLIPEGIGLSITGVVTFGAAVVLHGKVLGPPDSSPPPSTSPPTTSAEGSRRATMQQQLWQAKNGIGEFQHPKEFHAERDPAFGSGPIHHYGDSNVNLGRCGGRGCRGLPAEGEEVEKVHGQREDQTAVKKDHFIPSNRRSRRGTSRRLTLTYDRELINERREASRGELQVARKVLQQFSSSSSSPVLAAAGVTALPPTEVDVAAWLAVNRTLVECSPAGAILLTSPSNLVNLEFVGCQIVVYDTQGSNALIDNCVLRNTVDRPAILIRPGGRVSIQGTLFYNNSYLSSSWNTTAAAASNISNEAANFNSNLTWGAGSAIYVMPRGVINVISDSAFVNNGNGAGSTSGGAIYLSGPSACLEEVTTSTFLRNGRRAPGFQGGGAIHGEQVDGCDLTVRSTNFSGNAGGGGGSIYLSNSGGRSINFTSTKFWSNAALASGGALYVSDADGTLALAGTEFINNTASSERGGAMCLETVKRVTAEELLMYGNSAPLGWGGALAHSREGILDLRRSRVIYNRAMYGGGLDCSQDLEVRLSDMAIDDNTATMHAGGLECFQCYYFNATRTNFTRNSATSGGGLVLTQAAMGGVLTSVRLCDNVGMPTDGAASKIDQAGCGRDAQGGGGGLCLDLSRSVLLSGVVVSNNSAVAGGGAFVQQRCLRGETKCGPAIIVNSVFKDNTARMGGGGAIFRTTHNLTNITCPGKDTTPWQELHTACNDSWVNNTALYGNVTSTIAYRLELVSKQRISRYRSNDPLEVVVRVIDYHNQLITGGTREATTTVEVRPAGNSAVSLAGNSISTNRGIGNFTSTLRLQAKPGNYSISVPAPRTIQDVPPLALDITVRPCAFGEVTNKDGTQCYPCDLGSFSLNSSKTACDTCPDNANCSLAGLPWATLPKSGYWHSGPRSPNILACVYGAACESTKDWPRQDKMARYLKELDDGTISYNLTSYYALQCAKGYAGIMCGRCQHGYGRRESGKCTKCARSALNVLWYILSSLVSIVLIALTVRAQLPGSLTSHHRLEAMSEEQRRNPTSSPRRVVKQANNVDQHPSASVSTAAAATKDLGQRSSPPPTAGGPAGADGAGGAAATKGCPVAAPTMSAKDAASPPGAETAAREAAAREAEGQQQQVLGDARSNTTSGGRNIRPASPSSSSSSSDEDEVVLVDECEGPYKGGNHGVVFKILVSYLQVSSLIRSVSVPWPSVLGVFLSLIKMVGNSVSAIVSIDCNLKDGNLPISVQLVIITVCTPFVIMALALVVWLSLFLRHRIQRNPLGSSFSGYMRPRVIITVIAIVFYVYPDMTNTLLSLFSCPTVDPEENQYSDFMEARGTYWGRDPNLKCYTKPHLYLVSILGGPGVLLFAIGAPIFSFIWLRTHHALLYTSPEFGVSYGFMYEDYRRESYFWDSIIMFRKLAVISVIVFLQPQGQLIQIIAALGVILLATIAQLTITPYKNTRMNNLERLALYALVAILYFALLFLSDIPKAAKFALGMVLTLGNVALIIYFVWKIIYEVGLCIIWTIDDHSNADGRLEWNDIWNYVDAKHTNKFYTPALLKTLRGLQKATSFTHSMVIRPINAVSRASSRLRDHFNSRNRIKPGTSTAKDPTVPANPAPKASELSRQSSLTPWPPVLLSSASTSLDGGAPTDQMTRPPSSVSREPIQRGFTKVVSEPTSWPPRTSRSRELFDKAAETAVTRASAELMKVSGGDGGSSGGDGDGGGAAAAFVGTAAEDATNAEVLVSEVTAVQQHDRITPDSDNEDDYGALTNVQPQLIFNDVNVPYTPAPVPRRVLRTSGSPASKSSASLSASAAAATVLAARVPSNRSPPL